MNLSETCRAFGYILILIQEHNGDIGIEHFDTGWEVYIYYKPDNYPSVTFTGKSKSLQEAVTQVANHINPEWQNES